MKNILSIPVSIHLKKVTHKNKEVLLADFLSVIYLLTLVLKPRN